LRLRKKKRFKIISQELSANGLVFRQDYISAGLPDFSWSKIPKRGKYTKLPQNIPNDIK
jgi:hypothetical protein